jgi:hypothetical protein
MKALFEFDDHLTVVMEDDVSSIPAPAPGYPFDIASVAYIDLPVDFIRVETDNNVHHHELKRVLIPLTLRIVCSPNDCEYTISSRIVPLFSCLLI